MNKKLLFIIYCTLSCYVMCTQISFARENINILSLPPIEDSDFYDNGEPDPLKVELGRNLFFDKILSGNRNISCATCHHTLTDTGDGLSLPVGEGGRGLGITRDTGSGADEIVERVPRNAPPIFNLGAQEFRKMFHDGRVQIDPTKLSGFATPAGNNLPLNLDNVLAAQAMFPVTSLTEMAGQPGENSIADEAGIGNLAGEGGVWAQLADRLKTIPEYVDMFISAFDDINVANDIQYAHAANAIAAFEAKVWRFDNSPFDRYLRNEKRALSKAAKNGMRLFYGKAGCSSCHSGVFQTDHEFHAIAMPQIGPGRGNGVGGHEDFGREAVTGNIEDRYAFRTPTLRNVALTGPWGHDGAYNTLEAVVRHHLDSVNSLRNYDRRQAVLPSRTDLDTLDFFVMDDPSLVDNIAETNELASKELSDKDVQYLIDFLNTLTDPAALDLRSDTPKEVPSGLAIAD